MKMPGLRFFITFKVSWSSKAATKDFRKGIAQQSLTSKSINYAMPHFLEIE